MNGEDNPDQVKVEVVLSFVDEPPPNSGSQGAICIPVKPGYLMLTIFEKKILQRIHWKVRFDTSAEKEKPPEDPQKNLSGV